MGTIGLTVLSSTQLQKQRAQHVNSNCTRHWRCFTRPRSAVVRGGGSRSRRGGGGVRAVAEERSKGLASKMKEPTSTEQTMAEEAILSQHPLDPHKPNYSPLVPEFARPYPSFEGWYTRLWDPETRFSVAMIMATNYATQESQVTLLFTPSAEDISGQNGNQKYELRTYAVADMSTDARFIDEVYKEDSVATEPVGFEWVAPALGRLKITANQIELDMTVKGYKFKAHLTDEILWNADKSEKGPEGWARYLPIPTHWYVYSLGSKAEYEFSAPGGALVRKGTAVGHVEKNWGLTFPNGHVWFQGFSENNDAQIIGSAAFFKVGGVNTPYVLAMGYRSPVVSIDMRTNDVGTIFKDIDIRPLEGEFSVKGVKASHTIKIHAKADPWTLCEPILAPMDKVKWECACRETFLAEISVEVYEHSVWGIAGEDKLIDKKTFKYAGLEFGEDLLKEPKEKQGKEGQDRQIERSRAIDS
ncbi:hypothetical protein R1flu_022587 [Riccia fluitans]|uniref:Uncharacterized protein n=1 Tax=Riccia fluitans TaxID=41844 RepID=A0ABD1XPL2_9MARC